MRITDVKPYPLWGGGRNFFFVKVETDEGIWGIGEAGLTWQETAVEATVLRLKEWLVGQDPFRTEHLWQLMFRGGFFPGGNVTSAAISAIDIALWDIKGKALTADERWRSSSKAVVEPQKKAGSSSGGVNRRRVRGGWSRPNRL